MSEPIDHDLQRAADLVFATCRRVLGNDQDAADCAQEVLLRWWSRRERVRVSVHGWLLAAAHGAAVDMIRRREARRRAERAAPPTSAVPPPDAETGAVDACLAALSEADRALLVEHHLAGVGQSELAARLRCSQATVHRRLRQAAERFAALLRRRGVAVPAAGLVALIAGRIDAAAPPSVAQALAGHPAAAAIAHPPGIGLLSAHPWLAAAAALLALLLTVMAAYGWWWQTTTAEADREERAAMALVEAELTAQGLQVPAVRSRHWSIALLQSTLPAIDADVQRRWEDWCRAHQDDPRWEQDPPVNVTFDGPAPDSQAYRNMHGPIDLIRLRDWQAAIAPIRDCLHDGRFVAGSVGSLLARPAPEIEPAAWWPANGIGESVFLLRCIANTLIAEAVLADDPAPALRDLDHLDAAVVRGSYEWMSSFSCSTIHSMRSQAYVSLARWGRLPPDALARWQAEPPPHEAWARRGTLGDLLFWSIPSAEDLPDGLSVQATWWQRLAVRLYAPAMRRSIWRDVRETAAILAALHGRGTYGPQNAQAYQQVVQHDAWPWPIADFRMPVSTASYTDALLRGAFFHAAERIAARCIVDAANGTPLPERLTLLPTPGVPVFTYERLSPTRFILRIDPDAADQPSLLDRDLIRRFATEDAQTGSFLGRVSMRVDLASGSATAVPSAPAGPGGNG